ncbi:SGNH/GDSL hydrolase family protein [Vibrio sp. S4M6]|uniref:SGNH/GDSL hydrolase family protein n=1 Tax=Vibrio sinus TaxID=2946865 RepID=UPI00202A6024|nr:SGNH/GDSL hydrolase family protein [Vibrio sinus]MCL9783255.1 SGNH/GDSL hydrolase family protein [Vibrio sinus]
MKANKTRWTKKLLQFGGITSLLIYVFSSVPAYAAISHVIVLGDSLSDSGNNTWVTTEGPYVGAAITNPAQDGQRYTWANYFVKSFNQQEGDDGQSELTPSSKATLSSTNINYAWASAETGMHYLNDMTSSPYFVYNDSQCPEPGAVDPKNGVYCVPSVGKQIELFLSRQGLQQSYRQESLFILWAGGNDMFNDIAKITEKLAIKQNVKADVVQQQEFLKQLTQIVGSKAEDQSLSYPIVNIVKDINMLHNAGVPYNHILVIGMPDLTTVPAVEQMLVGNEWALPLVSGVSRLYNSALWLAVKLNTQAKTKFFNPLPLLNEIVDNKQYVTSTGETFSFPNVSEPCYKEPYSKTLPIRSCNGFLFYNLKHPSNETHQVLAIELWDFVNKNFNL